MPRHSQKTLEFWTFLERRRFNKAMGKSAWHKKPAEWWKDDRRDFKQIHRELREQTERIINSEKWDRWVSRHANIRHELLYILSQTGEHGIATIQHILQDFALIGKKIPGYKNAGDDFGATHLDYIYYALREGIHLGFEVRCYGVELLLRLREENPDNFNSESYNRFVISCIEDWGNGSYVSAKDNHLGYRDLIHKMALASDHPQQIFDKLCSITEHGREAATKHILYFDLLRLNPDLLQVEPKSQWRTFNCDDALYFLPSTGDSYYGNPLIKHPIKKPI